MWKPERAFVYLRVNEKKGYDTYRKTSTRKRLG